MEPTPTQAQTETPRPPGGKLPLSQSAAFGALGWLLAIGVLVAGVVGLPELRSEFSERLDTGRTPQIAGVPFAQRGAPHVEIHWPAMPASVVAEARRRGHRGPVTWLDQDSREQIERIVQTLATHDPFDHRSLESVHDALMSTGWFAQPVRVSRAPTGTVEVRGAWRVPAAAVRTNAGDRLVTGSGRLLSPVYLHDRSGLKLVLGASAEPRTLGESWPVGDVQAGLELLEFLRAMPGYEQVQGVDVSEFLKSGSLIVVTTTGTRVLWGGRVGTFHPGQAPDDSKRLRLAELFVRFGRIDAGQALIDLRTEDGPYILLRSIETARADLES